MKNLKGQYFSFDAIIASVIFVLTLTTLLSYWHSVRSSLDFQTNENLREAVRVSDLAFTPGTPANTICNLQSQFGFGVSWQDKRLNGTNLKSCAAAAASAPDTLTKGFSSSLQVSIKVEDESSITPNKKYYYIGRDMDTVNKDALRSISKFRRVATLVNETGGEEIAYLDFYVYN